MMTTYPPTRPTSPWRCASTHWRIPGDVPLSPGRWYLMGDWVCRAWKSRRDGKWCAVVHRARGELLCEPAGRTVMGSYDSADDAACAAKLMVDQVLLELSTRCG